ncbi:MAG: addiction module protein [Planctomycetota bacterium]
MPSASKLAPNTSRLFANALKLNPGLRLALADRLYCSLDPDPEVEAAWDKEIARRLRQVESGKAKLVPWSEIRRKLFSAECEADRDSKAAFRATLLRRRDEMLTGKVKGMTVEQFMRALDRQAAKRR